MPGFKPKGKQIEKLPEHLAKQVKSSEIEAATPVSKTLKIRSMFAPVAEPVYAPLNDKKDKGAKKAQKLVEVEEADTELPKVPKVPKVPKTDEEFGDI
jgi:hypothetical protein